MCVCVGVRGACARECVCISDFARERVKCI